MNGERSTLHNVLGKTDGSITEIRRLALPFADALAHRAGTSFEHGNFRRVSASDQLTAQKTIVLQVARGADNSFQKSKQRGRQFDPAGPLSTALITLGAYGRYRLSLPSPRNLGSVLYVRLECPALSRKRRGSLQGHQGT